MEPVDSPDENARKVVVLAPWDGRGMRALALALAAEGHSLILWAVDAAGEGRGPGKIPDEVLELQLAIERAGGISLYAGGAGLAGAAEAFGRIDEVMAEGEEAARMVEAAAAKLERRLRPGKVVIRDI